MLRHVRRPPSLAEQLASELAAVIDRLTLDTPHALQFWASYKDKEPLLDLVRVSWQRLRADELLTLEPTVLHAATLAFDEIERFGLWLRETETAPALMERRLEAARARLVPLAEAALQALGGPPSDPGPPDWLDTWRTLRR
ncbi:MAG: hypothetical protein H6732_13605 [Alphaproteobacteria bacterium]|nr:hypothetical protein [Alphaproteobacteria bacterium]